MKKQYWIFLPGWIVLSGAATPTDQQGGAAGAALYKGKMYLAGGLQDGHIGGHQPWLDS